MNGNAQRIIVGLSGGVDSAVTAARLVAAGFEVHGLFMKNWEGDDTDSHCTAATDLEDAKQVCQRLEIPLHQANFAAEYRHSVFEHCLREFEAGRTPNPDVLCNQHIKFQAFVDHARRLGADAVATGHYARRALDDDGRVPLLKGVDGNKDQSYFLYRLTQAQLAMSRFPLGDLTKDRVRRMAEDAGFENFDKKDSTGICFIGERDFRAFLAQYVQGEPGDIVTADGQIIGRHHGLPFYTIGQRQGLEIGGRAGHGGAPWYVAAKDLARNTLTAVQGHDHPALFAVGLNAAELSWVAGEPPAVGSRLAAKTRYRQPDQTCTVVSCDDRELVLAFDQPQRAVAPGQSVVLYDGECCLGGGVIQAATPLTGEAAPAGAAAR
ncbi:tRNA 2-thiouridine(34) synthase MnmA [Ectothiorhodospiraceae bacterium WFHF3C12]|nr:tRNA 2-thiouridine(34) synthase MnmA [Ectothiorhodospiraceae bacterium WFHF3C12]